MLIKSCPPWSLSNSPISICKHLTWGVLVYQLVLGIHLHMAFLESLLVFAILSYHLYGNARKNTDHVMHLFLVHQQVI